MPLPFLIQVPFDEIVRALNWTLIHSLWQGMILSVIAGVIVFLTKKTSPLFRYNLLTGSLIIFTVVIAFTFSRQIIKTREVVNVVQTIPVAQINTIEPAISTLAVAGKLSITTKAVSFLNAYASWIVLTWLLIIGFQFIRLTAGLYGIYQVKRRLVFSAGEYWNNRIAELSGQLQINKQVQLLQSGIAKIPAVIGYFKPVILFPAGMLASLPANEVEAILLHELAHIRRKDFLVNVLQNMLEIIFFFNPALLWVSSLIKSERENCCDDIAVSQINNKQNYIKALMSFQGFTLPVDPLLTTAFSGEKNHLMNRIKRIIYNNNKTLNNMEKKFLVSGMIVTSVFIFAFSSNNLNNKDIEKKIIPQVVSISALEKSITDLKVQTDTVPAKLPARDNEFSGKITTDVNGKNYTLVTKDNQVYELYINGKKVPTEKIGEYKTVTTKILKQYKFDAEQSNREWEQAALGMEKSKKDMEQYQLELERAGIELQQSQKEMIEDMEKVKMEIEESKRDMEQAKINKEIETEQYQQNITKEIERVKIEIEQAEKDMARTKVNKEMEMVQYQKDIQQAAIEITQSQKQILQAQKEIEQSKIRLEKAQKEMEQSKILQEKIIGDFIKENIIKDKKEISSYTLNNEELIVNGVKQTDAMHKKFKDKYVKNSNWGMSYNSN